MFCFLSEYIYGRKSVISEKEKKKSVYLYIYIYIFFMLYPSVKLARSKAAMLGLHSLPPQGGSTGLQEGRADAMEILTGALA